MSHTTYLPVHEDDKHTSNLFVLPSLFHEAMDMIFDSYEYFELQDSLDDEQMPFHIQTLMSNEMSRITMRLTSVMAWLMARKAVLAGQLSDEEATANYRIEGEEYCLQQFEELERIMPEYMVELLARSYKLYYRVWRLDQTLNAQH